MEKFFDLQRFVEEYYNDQPNKTLTGTNDADYFQNSGSIVKIYAQGGDDSIGNTGSVVTIAAGDGNNSIRSFGSDVSITAGNGNDHVDNYTSNSSTKNVKILVGDGNNSVFSSSESSYVTIVSGKGDDSIRNYTTNAKISVGAGNDSVWNYGYSTMAVLGAGDDYFHNVGSTGRNECYMTIDGGDGNDTIDNSWDCLIIEGAAGNDYVTNSYGDDVTIDGGKGNDYIYSFGSSNLFFGGAGDDTIKDDVHKGFGGSDSIVGGTGADLISLNSGNQYDVIEYTYGDGNDTIFGFNSTDTLQIATNKNFTTISSGSDLFIMFDNDEVITLKDVDLGVGDSKVGKKNIVTISGGNSGGGTSTETLPSGLTLKSTTLTASKNFKGKTIDLTKYSKVKTLNASAVTQALKITGNKLANKISGGKGKDTIYGGAGNDSILGNAGNDKLFGDAGNDTLSGGNGNDTLTGGKGNDVFVYTKGKDVITDYASGDKIFLQNTVIKSWKFKQKDLVLTTETGTVTVKNGKGKKISFAMEKTFSSKSALFAEENNFATADTDNLSAIVENNSVGEFKFNYSEKLTQENLITFADN